MSGAVGLVDGLVREYLVYRGFSGAAKALEAESRVDKSRGFRVERLVEQMIGMISSFDLVGLTELWTHLNSTVLLGLTKFQSDYASKVEEDVLKLYLANSLHTKRSEKATEFFRLLGPKLHGQPNWKDWFSIPYLPNPEELSPYRPYFSKPWQDAFLTSLHNFLAIAFHQMDVPRLLAYLGRPASLANDDGLTTVSKSLLRHQTPPSDLVASAELMDDFYIIAQSSDSSVPDKSASKSLKSVLKRKFTKAKP